MFGLLAWQVDQLTGNTSLPVWELREFKRLCIYELPRAQAKSANHITQGVPKLTVETDWMAPELIYHPYGLACFICSTWKARELWP